MVMAVSSQCHDRVVTASWHCNDTASATDSASGITPQCNSYECIRASWSWQWIRSATLASPRTLPGETVRLEMTCPILVFTPKDWDEVPSDCHSWICTWRIPEAGHLYQVSSCHMVVHWQSHHPHHQQLQLQCYCRWMHQTVSELNVQGKVGKH